MSKGTTPTLAGVTTIVAADQGEINKRKASGVLGAAAYPFGGNPLTHEIVKNDVVWGWKRTASRPNGSAQEMCTASVNGVVIPSGSLEELRDNAYFIGLMKNTRYRSDDPAAPPNKLAILRAGTGETWMTSPGPVFVGDELVWDFPDPNSRAPQWEGKPKEKIPLVIKRLDFNDLNSVLTSTLNKALLPADKKGVADVPLFEERDRHMKQSDQAALHLKEAAIAQAVRSIKALVDLGIVRIVTPEREAREKAFYDFITGLNVAPENKAAILDRFRSVIDNTPLAGFEVPVTNPAVESAGNAFDGSLDAEDLFARFKMPTSGHHGPAIVTRDVIRNKKISSEKQALWLSAVLGGVDSRYVEPSSSLQEEILRAVYAEETLDLTKMVPPHPFPALSQSADANILNLVSQFIENGSNAALHHLVAQANLRYSITRRKVGMSLDTSEPTSMRSRFALMLGYNCNNSTC